MITPSDLYWCRKSSWFFISNFCTTVDEHDQEDPVKYFPRHWEHLPLICGDFEQALLDYKEKGVQVLIYPKSRQVMVSWIFDALLLWLMTKVGQLAFIQGKRLKDSVYQMNRLRKMYERLPEPLKVILPLGRPLTRQAQETLEFKNGSSIVAIAQGGDIIRSHTPTVLFGDEFAFQPEAEDSLKAAKACCQLIALVSTAEPGYFQRLVEDTDGD